MACSAVRFWHYVHKFGTRYPCGIILVDRDVKPGIFETKHFNSLFSCAYNNSYAFMHCVRNAYLCNILGHNKRNTIVLRGGSLSNFKIPSIPPTTNKTIRFPNDVIENIEEAIKGKNCTFSAFVISAVRAALDEIKENP